MRRRELFSSLRVVFGIPLLPFGSVAFVRLPTGVAARPVVGRSHHGSIRNPKNIVDEAPGSRRVTCCHTVGGLSLRHVGANVRRERQCANAKIDKASCDQCSEPLQVVVLLISAMTAVGQLFEFARIARVPNQWSIDIVPTPVHSRRRPISRNARLEPSVDKVVRQGQLLLDLHQEHEPFIAHGITAERLGREPGNPIPRKFAGRDTAVPSGKTGLGTRPLLESNPLRLNTIFMAAAYQKPWNA